MNQCCSNGKFMQKSSFPSIYLYYYILVLLPNLHKEDMKNNLPCSFSLCCNLITISELKIGARNNVTKIGAIIM